MACLVAGSILGASLAACLHGQVPEYTLGIEGPEFLHGPAGGKAVGTYHVTLQGLPPHLEGGAMGWSFALEATGCRVKAVTLGGTAGERASDGGSERTSIVGDSGVVSQVSLPLASELELGIRHRLAAVHVEADVPPDGNVELDVARLYFVDSLQGPGGIVRQRVQHRQLDLLPLYNGPAQWIDLIPDDACVPMALAFSTQLMESPVPYAGILGGRSTVGELVIATRPGESILQQLRVNLVSAFPGQDPEQRLHLGGWSLSVAIYGEGVSCVSASADGMITDRFAGGFKKVECIDPAVNGGRRGVVGAWIQDDFGVISNVPARGTYSILELGLALDAPPIGKERRASLRFEDGLQGSGQPVLNALALDGSRILPCNVFDAAATLRVHPTRVPFVRGNANNDRRVDLSDAVWILAELFLGTTRTSCARAADVNDDGTVNISDAVTILTFQFLGGIPIPAPFPQCGLDPGTRGDALGCDDPPAACS